MFIVTASNDQYAQHAAVMLTSLFENADKNSNIHIFIIDGDLSDINKSKLQRVAGRFNKQVAFLRVDKELFTSFPMHPKSKHITKETYYRIIIPDLLRVNKALYLDCDLIVEEDLSPLWDINISQYYLGAVDTAYLLPEESRKSRNRGLSIPEDSYYFNAGVLLLNLEKWRKENIPTQLINFITNNPEKLRLMDQDALNSLLYDRWLVLDPKWNYTSVHHKRRYMEKPAIIHFTGRKKPWNSNHPYKRKYLQYLASSLWNQDI